MTWLQFFAFLVLTALVSAFSAPAGVCASETEKVDVIIPVSYTADHVDVTLRCKLEYEETEGQIITNDTLYLEDGEEGSFTITYTVPGTYFCQLRQVKGTVNGVAYDEHIVNVAIYVTTDDTGKLYADAVLYEDGSDKLPSAYFINIDEALLTPTPEVSPTPTESPSATPTPETSITRTVSSETTSAEEPTPTAAANRTEETNPVKTADETPSAKPYVVLMLLAILAVPAVLVIRKGDVK